ncbi:acyltransferase family protein [Sphingomonas sp. G-3-2-10]|uniref:acyltransferase family protein n=1 Tax=Sphingomonas sp. G-3-2-10 TaxID=2728838 RepID=UPI00146D44AE|nr:acyltransferase family protein [Sphingomonas sp. G-3-2-10]NML06285.1 acyltransferase [Sphingomonas sp. G-3-2-10]
MNSIDETGAQPRRPLLAYWPEVDGLRTLAVLAVVLFHFERSWLGGGFVGVDIFFVISGFLITAILLEDRDRGKFSLGRFYQRRISRIAPAFFLVLFATLIGAWFVYSDQDFASAGANAAFAAVSLANVKYMLMGSYFTVSPDAQPFLHYWSLAVEEQFYLFFPFYLYAVTRWTRWPVAITLVLAALSLILCIAVTVVKPVYAFYLLPTRGWELLAGAAVTMLRWRGITPGEKLSPWLSWGGLALVVVSVVALREGENFPGFLAALPVLGTVAILATAGDPRPVLNRWLGHKLPVHIGKRSYSLYLWHWPIFSLVDYQLYASDEWTRGALKIGLTLAATWISYALVERPARLMLNRPSRRMLAFMGFFAAAAGTFAAGMAIRNAHYLDASPDGIAGGGIVASEGSRGRVVLVGDSQASMYARDLGMLAKSRGYGLNVLSMSAGDQLPGREGSTWPAVWSYLSAQPVDVVVLAEAWDDKLTDPAVLQTALAQFASRNIHVILVQQIPGPPKTVNRDAIRHGLAPPFVEDDATVDARMRGRAIVAAAASPSVTVVDPAPLFLSPDGSLALIGGNGRLNYQDERHLSDTGNQRVMPLLDAAIEAALKRRD